VPPQASLEIPGCSLDLCLLFPNSAGAYTAATGASACVDCGAGKLLHPPGGDGGREYARLDIGICTFVLRTLAFGFLAITALEGRDLPPHTSLRIPCCSLDLCLSLTLWPAPRAYHLVTAHLPHPPQARTTQRRGHQARRHASTAAQASCRILPALTVAGKAPALILASSPLFLHLPWLSLLHCVLVCTLAFLFPSIPLSVFMVL
jgi:hypothetical protein